MLLTGSDFYESLVGVLLGIPSASFLKYVNKNVHNTFCVY